MESILNRPYITNNPTVRKQDKHVKKRKKKKLNFPIQDSIRENGGNVSREQEVKRIHGFLEDGSQPRLSQRSCRHAFAWICHQQLGA